MSMPNTPSTGTHINDLRGWLLGRAVPLWLSHGIDRPAGAFHEALAPDSYACDAPFRRLRVVTRQIVVFSEAHRAGISGADEAAALGVEFLARHAAVPGGGYAWRFDLRNRPTDTTRDLYDHAFVLLALAHATAILPLPGLRTKALDLLSFLDRHMRHPNGGWIESIPPRLPRRQNPHMHLLEAMLAAFRAFGDAIFLERASTLVALCLERLIDPDTGLLPEYFDDALRPQTDDGFFLAEPGHHCEWVWLLQEYARCGGPRPGQDHASARLLRLVDLHGIHPTTGDLIDSVGSDGTRRSLSMRLWPQTERLRTEFVRSDGSPAGRSRAATSVAAYLREDGLWFERRNSDGTFVDGPSPATSLYHLVTGILTAADINNGAFERAEKAN